MSCDFRDSVAAHLLGALPTAEAIEVDRHVLGCDECAQMRRELAIVPTLLAVVDPRDDGEVPPPDDLGDLAVRRMLAQPDAGDRRSRWRRQAAPFLAGVAATVLLGVVPLGVWSARHDAEPTATVQLTGTSAAPDAWAEAKLHPRSGGGTIVDFEAGDLPGQGNTYVVTLTQGGRVVARQQFRADADGWGQVVLATTAPVGADYAIDVVRRDRAGSTRVLQCDCDA